MCGAIDLNPMVAKWLNGGKKPRLEDGEQFQGIVINPETGEALEFNETLRIYPTYIPWAGGSGRDAALAAFVMGYDARAAVEVACKVDMCSGLPVQEVKIGSATNRKESRI